MYIVYFVIIIIFAGLVKFQRWKDNWTSSRRCEMEDVTMTLYIYIIRSLYCGDDVLNFDHVQHKIRNLHFLFVLYYNLSISVFSFFILFIRVHKTAHNNNYYTLYHTHILVILNISMLFTQMLLRCIRHSPQVSIFLLSQQHKALDIITQSTFIIS